MRRRPSSVAASGYVAGEPGLDRGQQRGLRARPDVVAVEALELLHVEARRTPAHGVEVEPGDGLVGVDDLVVAVTPAEPEERVAHRLGQNAELVVGADGDGAVPLGELGAVRAVDQRNVGVERRLPAQREEELGLAKGVGEVVVPPDRVGDPHVVVVDDDREHVGRRAVGAQQHHVVERAVADPDRSLHQVVDHGLAFLRRAEADDGIDAGRCLGRIALAPAPVVERRAAGGAGVCAHGLQLFRRAVAAIGPAGGEQAARDRDMPRAAL